MRKILSKWYVFSLSIAVVVVSFCVITYAKTTPKEEERITFVVGAYDTDVNSLSSKLMAAKPNSIKEINSAIIFPNMNNVEYSDIFL